MDKAITCIIVDDEPIARQGMEELVNKTDELRLLGVCRSAEQAMEMIRHKPVELIFLDIEMPGINGLDFAASLKDVLVVFTTAYSRYALESYAVDALDYLVKPIQEARFLKAVEKAKMFRKFLSEQYEKSSFEYLEDENLVVRAERKVHKLKYSDIRYIEGLKDYIVICLKDCRIVTAMNLKNVHLKLPEQMFKRISKSYIVNTGHVTAVSTHSLFLNEDELPLGAVYRTDFLKEYLGDYFKKK